MRRTSHSISANWADPMRRCPECDSALPGTVSKCARCGWGKSAGADMSQYHCPKICEAHGCFVAGGMIAGVWGAEAGRRDGAPRTAVCRFHQSHPTHQWQAITRNLHRMRVLIQVLDWVQSLVMVDRVELQLRQIEGFQSRDGESIFEWTSRATAFVRARAHKDLPHATENNTGSVSISMQQIIQSVKRRIENDSKIQIDQPRGRTTNPQPRKTQNPP